MRHLNTKRALSGCLAGAGVALLAAAPAARGDYVYVGPSGGSWFDAANWVDTSTDPNTANVLPDNSQTTNVNNGSAGGGVIFDPVAQGGSTAVTIGRLYISSNNSGPGSSDPEFSSLSLQPNVLTVNSGTLTTGDQFHVGRHADGTFNLNGGALVATDLRMTDTSDTSATINYTGGTLTVGQRIRMAKGGGSTSTFIVGNSAGGRITLGTDFLMAEGANSHATVEFHYQNGGVQTIEAADELSLRNGAGADVANRSARLNLVLDEAPLVDLDGTVVDLALFALGNVVGTTTNVGGGIARFRDVANTDYYDEGDIISAVFGATTYNWQITYSGSIALDANGAVTGITGAGTGNDVVLIGQLVPEPATSLLMVVGAAVFGRRRGTRRDRSRGA